MLDIMQAEPINTLGAIQIDVVWSTVIVTVAGGALLLFWGVKLARLLMVLAGGTAGFLVAAPLAERIGTTLGVTRAAMIFCFAALGLVTSRISWAVLASVVMSATCGVVLAACFAPGALPDRPPLPVTEEAIVDLSNSVAALATPESAREHYERVRTGVSDSLGTMGMLLYAGVGAVAAVVLFVGLVWPQPIQALVSAPLGAAAIIWGILIAAGSADQDWLKPMLTEPLYPLVAMGVLALIGLLVQFRAVAVARGQKDSPPPRHRSSRKRKSGRRSTDR